MIIETKVFRFEEGKLIETQPHDGQFYYEPGYSYLVVTAVNGIPKSSEIIKA